MRSLPHSLGTDSLTLAKTSKKEDLMEPKSSSDVQVFFNPNCSKCRSVRAILEEKGLGVDYIRYLEHSPSKADLERVMGLLGIHDPRQMMRTKERSTEN